MIRPTKDEDPYVLGVSWLNMLISFSHECSWRSCETNSLCSLDYDLKRVDVQQRK